jgi:type III restriction enzyme
VIGRALRRQSYELNDEGLFNVEYADVLGIPFDFTAKPVISPPAAPRETVRVHAVKPDRDALEITFPRVEGYRVELPDERLEAIFGPDHVLELTPQLLGPPRPPIRASSAKGVDLTLEHLDDMRSSTILFHLGTGTCSTPSTATRARNRSCTSSASSSASPASGWTVAT